MKKKVLVIIAHPDDEIIWMGGLLLKHSSKDWDVTVVCLCRGDDLDRAPKFKRVCEILKVKSFISDLDDELLNPININIIKSILQPFTNKTYDYIFTHGENGEYNHIRHKETHQAVKKLIKENKLKSKKTFLFSYQKKENNYQGYCICNSNASNFIKLNNQELSMKKELITDIYGYQKGGFEELSCSDTEAFDKLK